MDQYFPLIVLSTERALKLCSTFEARGISARIDELVVRVPGDQLVRVCVERTHVDEAVRILEGMLDLKDTPADVHPATTGTILIPVDFSDKSLIGCRVGFELAARLQAKAVILNSYAPEPFEDALGRDGQEEGETVLADNGASKVQQSAMKSLEKDIERHRANGEIVDVTYSSELRQGMPEDVILNFARSVRPKVIVMATRSSHKKVEDLVGSVTAEVLDGCRTPLFTVPEGYDFPGIREIKKLVFLCNLDRNDPVSMERFLRLFDYPEAEITLVPVSDRYGIQTEKRLSELREQFESRYPSVKFDMRIFPMARFRESFREFTEAAGIELLVVQNKKKNIFTRLINPGLAHVLFYERDMPMMVLPV